MTRREWIDPIVEEVRKHREAYSAQFGHDIHAICEDLRRRTASGELTTESLLKELRGKARSSKAGKRRCKKSR